MIELTTYQLTADFLIKKHGKWAALELAHVFAKSGDKFWNYVAICIINTMPVA